jgi:hypothetical protein
MSSSKHRRESSEDDAEEETAWEEEFEVEGVKEGPEEAPVDLCEGCMSDRNYPEPPVIEEEAPDDLTRAENQDEPKEDPWLCPACNHSPCSFLQYQEELERICDIMYPEVSNKVKRYHMYKHMTRRLHGQLAKHERKELPPCMSQGLKDLFPSESYTGFKPSPYESGQRGDRDRGKDDGSTYN